jgi:hypothetical protein
VGSWQCTVNPAGEAVEVVATTQFSLISMQSPSVEQRTGPETRINAGRSTRGRGDAPQIRLEDGDYRSSIRSRRRHQEGFDHLEVFDLVLV